MESADWHVHRRRGDGTGSRVVGHDAAEDGSLGHQTVLLPELDRLRLGDSPERVLAPRGRVASNDELSEVELATETAAKVSESVCKSCAARLKFVPAKLETVRILEAESVSRFCPLKDELAMKLPTCDMSPLKSSVRISR